MARTRQLARLGRRRALAAVLPLAAVLALPASASAQHSLFRPVPTEQLRPLSTDRPDVTESPFTVDAGHWQVEFDFFNLARDDQGPAVSRTVGILPANIKVGLHPRADAQLIVQPYVRRTTTPKIGTGQTRTETRGAGDTTMRLKVNVVGNDGGPAALAVLPFVTVPTGGEERGAGEAGFGVAVPLALALEGGTTASFMVQGASAGVVDSWLYTASLSRSLGPRLGGFLELAAGVPIVDGDIGDWQTTLDAGLTLGLAPQVQLDGAILIGLTDAAPDVTGYVGMSFRR